MKPALYYSIRRNYGHSIIAVTSEKGPKRAWDSARWFGREVEYNTATNGTGDQLRGRFATLEAATEVKDAIKIIGDMYDEARKVHYDAVTELFHDEGSEIEALIKKVEANGDKLEATCP